MTRMDDPAQPARKESAALLRLRELAAKRKEVEDEMLAGRFVDAPDLETEAERHTRIMETPAAWAH